MTTEQLVMLPLEDLKRIPKPSKRTETTTEPKAEEAEEESEPEVPPEAETDPPEEEESEVKKSRAHYGGVSGYVNIKTWGVRNTKGEWVTIPGDPETAPMDYRQCPRLAENLTHKEALRVFETHPAAFQLVDGCDVWACLSDEPEVFVVRKEKDVPPDEAVSGTGAAVDGPGNDETAPPVAEEVIERVA